jgi:sugar/nucleoside kinase (ribokinase family)
MKNPEVVSIGNMLVEIMRKELDRPLNLPAEFVGPFPSGDTPIYIDTVARLGHAAGFIGAVGPDDFGRCLLDRFAGGGRKFIYHWRHAAAGCLAPEHVHAGYFESARWLHLTGCNLAASPTAKEACYKAMELLPAGARVSFDANIRPELLTIEDIRGLVGPALARADVILPSLTEAAMLTGMDTDEQGCQLWASQGKTVVLKKGAKGCRIYSGKTAIDVPGFVVHEVDPTGAGDSFCAGFTVAMLENMPLEQAGRFANAVGALAVTRLGPMEGAPDRPQVMGLLGRS